MSVVIARARCCCGMFVLRMLPCCCRVALRMHLCRCRVALRMDFGVHIRSRRCEAALQLATQAVRLTLDIALGLLRSRRHGLGGSRFCILHNSLCTVERRRGGHLNVVQPVTLIQHSLGGLCDEGRVILDYYSV